MYEASFTAKAYQNQLISIKNASGSIKNSLIGFFKTLSGDVQDSIDQKNECDFKKEWFDKLRSLTLKSFQAFDKISEKKEDFLLTAIYIVCYSSLAEMDTYIVFLVHENIKLITTLCFLLNPDSAGYVKAMMINFDEEWYSSKLKMTKQFLASISTDMLQDKTRYLWWLESAFVLNDYKLRKKIENAISDDQPDLLHIYNRWRERNRTFEEIISEEEVVRSDETIYDRARDPPGQRGVYIPPGDTAKESYRLSTYIKFPQESPVSPRNLASAGFYFTGYKDRVKCFCCGLCVENWAVSDDVKASRWHRSDCQMMRGEECRNIPVGVRFPRFSNAAAANLATEGSQTSNAASSGNITVSSVSSRDKTNLTVPPAGVVLSQPTGERREFTQTARPVNQPQQVNILPQFQRIDLATIVSAHHEQLIRNLDLRRESERMQSFVSWPQDNTVTPSDLARSGFFYLGNLDRVQCFSCGGVLRNWNTGDNVHAEHGRHFSHCRMVQRTENQNVALSAGVHPTPPSIPNAFPEPPDPSESGQRNLLSMFQCLYPVSPHMRNEDTRFETFDHQWPTSQVRATPRQIAGAGFFFLGERDRVKCWYCNGGLQNWDPNDEPRSEHAKWFPTCEFLLHQKGPDFVNRMVSMFPTSLPRPILRGPFDVPPQSRGQMYHRPPSPPPPIIDPRIEMQRVTDQLNKAMNSSIVASAIEMGFEYERIRQHIRRRLGDGLGMYQSVGSLVEELALLPSTENSDSDENRSDDETGSSLPEPTRIKTTGGSENTREHFGETTGGGIMQITEGAEARGSNQEEPMEESISLPEDTTPSMAARIRELQEERNCKICMDRLADIAFVPCGHLCTCAQCAGVLRKCPLCRVKIEKAIPTSKES